MEKPTRKRTRKPKPTSAAMFEHLGSLRDVEQVKEAIRTTYGFQVTDDYAKALVNFVDKMTRHRRVKKRE